MPRSIHYKKQSSEARGNVSINAGNNVTVTESNGEYTISNSATDFGPHWTKDSHGSLIPNAHDTYDIGEPENKVRDLYLGNNSLHIGGETIGYDEATSTLTLNNNDSIAKQTALNTLSGTVSGKADQGALDTLSGTVSGKADQSALDTLSGTVSGKSRPERP